MRNEFLRKFLATQLFTNLITLGEFSFSKMTLNLKMILAGHIQPKRRMQFLRIKNSRIIFFFTLKKIQQKSSPVKSICTTTSKTRAVMLLSCHGFKDLTFPIS